MSGLEKTASGDRIINSNRQQNKLHERPEFSNLAFPLINSAIGGNFHTQIIKENYIPSSFPGLMHCKHDTNFFFFTFLLTSFGFPLAKFFFRSSFFVLFFCCFTTPIFVTSVESARFPSIFF